MIVPRIPLILLAGFILLPATVAAAHSTDLTTAAWAVTALLFVVAAVDARRGKRRYAGVTVSAPSTVRMTVNKTGYIQLTIAKPEAAALPVRIGLALPPALVSDHEAVRLRLTDGQAEFSVSWPCRAVRRGLHHAAACHIEIPSRWGLWAMRRKFSLTCEVRVYPNLSADQKNLNGLFNPRELGWRSMRKLGKGREFEQLRDYLPGDSYEDIDWKATARRRFPVTRVFQVEQSQEIYVVLDASLLSRRSAAFVRDRRKVKRHDGSNDTTTIFERYITAALVMALTAERAADRYGLLIFGSTPDCFIKAGRGKAHFNACREALYNRMPRKVSPDFDELFTFIGTHLRKRALLVFLTNLDDPLLSENFVAAMRVAARQHLLMVNMFRPPGAYPLFSSKAVDNRQDIYEHLTGHISWTALSDTRRKLRRYGAGFALLEKKQLCSQLVGQYMDVKQRQLL
ncbi:MAG: DUF58 domain-containing protein [Desulfatitalea sp.]|nr:DUF58 domain-containing protein [Desulfatitalea sp.]NNK00584.1 DUF58 domain-containing protein [Desulfatitalea sp.]